MFIVDFLALFNTFLPLFWFCFCFTLLLLLCHDERIFIFFGLVSITTPISVVSLCFIFAHIYISCLHHAIFVYVYISCFQLVDMVLVFASHLHYNPITSTWCLFLHHMCIAFVFASQMLLLSSCLFYIILLFCVNLLCPWNYLVVSFIFVFDLCKFLRFFVLVLHVLKFLGFFYLMCCVGAICLNFKLHFLF